MRSPVEVIPRGRILLAAAALAASVLVLYGRTASHSFVNFDDDTYITENRRVLDGLSADGIRWAFTTTTESNWHPLTWISLMGDATLARWWGAPRALESVVHFRNTLLHAANAVLLFLALVAMTRRFATPLVVAALFAVHPLHVESVAWAAERKDVLSGFFWMAAMLAWAWYARRPGLRRMVVVAALLALGLLAKPMLVTLPAALLLVDVWPLDRLREAGWKKLVWEKAPLFALAAASSAATWIVQSRGGAASSLEAVPLAARCANAVAACVVYLRKTVWPVDLAVFYPHPALLGKAGGTGAALAALAAAALLAAVTWGALTLRARRPWLAVGWLWFLGTLVPVIGIVQVGRQSYADRYTYLPLIGLFVMAAWAAAEWTGRRPASRHVVTAATLLALAVLSLSTWFQVGRWKDGETLYRHALRVTRDNYIAHNNLGVTLMAAGRTEDAAVEYEAALKIKPDYAEAHNNLGVVRKRQGRLAEAERHFKATLAIRPRFEEAYSNLGNVYQARGEMAAARAQYETALRLVPDYTEALVNYGTLLAKVGDLPGAEARLRRAVTLEPTLVEARKNLGIVLLQQGKRDEAAAEYERALALRPGQVDLLCDLGIIRMRQDRLDEAERHLSEALRRKPDYPPALAALSELRFRRRAGPTADRP